MNASSSVGRCMSSEVIFAPSAFASVTTAASASPGSPRVASFHCAPALRPRAEPVQRVAGREPVGGDRHRRVAAVARDELGRRRLGDDRAALDHADAIAQPFRLFDVVRREDDRLARRRASAPPRPTRCAGRTRPSRPSARPGTARRDRAAARARAPDAAARRPTSARSAGRACRPGPRARPSRRRAARCRSTRRTARALRARSLSRAATSPAVARRCAAAGAPSRAAASDRARARARTRTSACPGRCSIPASWSCRRRCGRAIRRSLPRGTANVMPSTAAKSPYRFTSCSTTIAWSTVV